MPQAGTVGASRAAELLWTDYLFLGAMAMAVWAAVDPLGQPEFATNALLKHLPLLLAAPTVALALVLRATLQLRPGRTQGPLAAPLAAAWPLALFSLIVLAGSAYARLALGIENTFLVYGLYSALTFGAAAMVLQCRAPLALLRGHFAILVPAALFMGAMLVYYMGRRQVFHEEIFLVIPMAALVFAAPLPASLRWGGALFFLSMAWFSHKLTSYIVGVLAAVYLLACIGLPRRGRRDPLSNAAIAYWSVVGLIAACAAAVTWSLSGGGGSGPEPTGNVEFRAHTYLAAWDRFVDSPLWGSAFAREATEKFTLYDVGISGNVLPTHSDLLDLLSAGGLLGFGLWAAGLAMIGRLAWRRLLGPRAARGPLTPYAHALALLSLSAFAVCAFNPILLQPPMAALAWCNLGLLLGLALRAET